jgi:hypothetical protein
MRREPWNKGKLVGHKAPFKLKQIWAIRVRLQLAQRRRTADRADGGDSRAKIADPPLGYCWGEQQRPEKPYGMVNRVAIGPGPCYDLKRQHKMKSLADPKLTFAVSVTQR